MPNTPLLQIPQVAANQAAKETTINDGFSILERSLNDVTNVDMSGGSVTLGATDYTRYMLFKCSGATAAVTLTVPASKRLFMAYNAGTSAVTVTPAGTSGTTAAVPPGSFVVLFNDGTNVLKLADSAAAGGVVAFTSLPDTPKSYTGDAGKALVVKSTEDGLTYGTIAVKFTDLTDGPENYTGAALKALRVNAAGTALEYYTPTAGAIAFDTLTDVPSTYAGQAGKLVVVNGTESGLIFQTIDTSAKQTIAIAGTNFDFESGATGWTQTGSDFHVVSSYSSISPHAGSGFLCAYGSDTADQNLVQTIDLTAFASTAQLDDAGTMTMTWWTQTVPNCTDQGCMKIEFLDSAGTTVLSTTTSALATNQNTWVQRAMTAALPTGTRKMRVTLTAHDVDGSGAIFAFDTVTASLAVPVASYDSFDKLLDVPNSYAGAGGKVVMVKSDASGLQFGSIPFSALTDGLAYTSAQANKVLAVKSDGSGLQWVTPSSGGGSGTVASPTQARYWQLTLRNTSGASNIGLSEVGFHVTTGGPAVEPVSITASSTYVGETDPATNLIDGLDSTHWASSDATPCTLSLDFGLPVTLVEVLLKARNDTYYNQAPTSFDVASSQDNSTFTAIGTFTPASWTAADQHQTFAWASEVIQLAGLSDVDFSIVPSDGQTLTYSATSGKWHPVTPSGGGGGGGSSPGARRYWRFELGPAQDASNTAQALGGLALRATTGGSALAVSAATASTSYSGSFPPSNLTDSDPGTVWSAASGDPAAWIEYDLGTASAVAQIALTSRGDGYVNTTPNIIRVLYSSDGVLYYPLCTLHFPAFTSTGQTQLSAIPT